MSEYDSYDFYDDDDDFYEDEEYFEDEDSDFSDLEEMEAKAEAEADTKAKTEQSRSEEKPANLEPEPMPMFLEDYYFENEGENLANADGLTFEEQMDIFADSILGSILSGKDGWKEQLNIFRTTLQPKVFTNERFLLAETLQKKMKAELLKPEIFQIYLRKEIGTLSEKTDNINLAIVKQVNGSPEQGLIRSTVEKYRELRETGVLLSEEEFRQNIDLYKILYREVELAKVFDTGKEIVTTGIGSSRRRMIGPDQAINYVKRKFADIQGVLEDQEGKGFLSMKDTILTEEEKKPKNLVCDFGSIPTLNNEYGGIYTGNFYQIAGPPKGGKTKMCASRCHDALINGHNITVWPQEGGYEMWTAQMRAIHCYYYHNHDKSISELITGLPSQQDILNQRIPEEVKGLEKASCLDLISNPTYGKIDYIDRPFNMETFIDEIDTSVSHNNSDFVIIDYMQLIDSENSRMATHEVLQKAYKKLLNYCKKKNVAVLTPVQYKQEFVTSLAGNGNGDDIDMRVSAGGSAEVIRTPDMTMPLWASTQDLENNIAYIQSIPNRLGKVVPRIKLNIDLDYCLFSEEVDE